MLRQRVLAFSMMIVLLAPFQAFSQSPQPTDTNTAGPPPSTGTSVGTPGQARTDSREIPYSEVVRKARAGELQEILVRAQNGPFPLLIITTRDGSSLESTMPTLRLDERLMDTGTVIRADNGSPVSRASSWLANALWVTMMLSSIGLVMFLIRQNNKGSLSKFEMPAGIPEKNDSTLTLSSVAGQEEAKRELMEIVDFMRSPARYKEMGAKIPKGVLLEGHPGNGKTLLARAIAEEAGVAFYHLDASALVEMFAGMAPRRVRSAFKTCRKNAPCILFIDEIDSIGKKRGQGAMGAQNEYDSTLNQILTEMDGIKNTLGKEVIVIGATNRADMLDPALTRPGRLTRRIFVADPTLTEREAILRLHARTVPVSSDDIFSKMARITPGCSGADLANLVNEGAIIAVKHGRKSVEMGDLLQARDRFLLGLPRPSGIMNDAERRISAVHEAGHAVASLLIDGADPVQHASIQPRGGSLGHVMSAAERDAMLVSRDKLLGRLQIYMAGRAAEIMVFGEGAVTSGAREDLKAATRVAREMIGRLGMGTTLGFMATNDEDGLNSSAQKALLDAEVQELLKRCMKDVQHLLSGASILHSRIIDRLLDEETISGDDLRTMRDDSGRILAIADAR